MASSRPPGPTDRDREVSSLDGGTLARVRTPPPGVVGIDDTPARIQQVSVQPEAPGRTANNAVEATVATVYPDRVVLTSPRFERGRFGRTEPNAVVVRQNDVARVAVLKLPRHHKVSPERSDPRVAWRFASGRPVGTKVRVRKRDGSRVEGRIVTTDDRTLTLTVDKQPAIVAFTDVREVGRRGGWTTGRKVGLAAGVALGILMGLASGLER